MNNNLKLLCRILSDGGFHSGSELEKALCLTRGAIWNLISKLDVYGIEVEAKTNLGYRIPQGLELINKNIIKKYLSKKNQHHLKNMFIFEELPSTNTYLTELKSEKNGVNICLAESQTAGKGRLGRHWISPYAKNIYLSISNFFSKDPAELSKLSLISSIAVLNALKIYGIKNELNLKWPNDVLWKHKKLSGILLEISGEDHHLYKVVIGVGINVAMPPKQGQKIDQAWCDIAKITGTTPQRNKLTGILLEQLLTSMNNYQQRGFKPFIKKWIKTDICYGRPVSVIASNKIISGIGRGIDEHGHFLLEDEKGKIHAYASGEITIQKSTLLNRLTQQPNQNKSHIAII